MCIVERLFSSSLVALVELSNPRKLRVCHFKVWFDVYCDLTTIAIHSSARLGWLRMASAKNVLMDVQMGNHYIERGSGFSGMA